MKLRRYMKNLLSGLLVCCLIFHLWYLLSQESNHISTDSWVARLCLLTATDTNHLLSQYMSLELGLERKLFTQHTYVIPNNSVDSFHCKAFSQGTFSPRLLSPPLLLFIYCSTVYSWLDCVAARHPECLLALQKQSMKLSGAPKRRLGIVGKVIQNIGFFPPWW